MRDDVVRLVRETERGRAGNGAIETYVIANNKAEGSSPLTVRGIAEELVAG